MYVTWLIVAGSQLRAHILVNWLLLVVFEDENTYQVFGYGVVQLLAA